MIPIDIVMRFVIHSGACWTHKTRRTRNLWSPAVLGDGAGAWHGKTRVWLWRQESCGDLARGVSVEHSGSGGLGHTAQEKEIHTYI